MNQGGSGPGHGVFLRSDLTIWTIPMPVVSPSHKATGVALYFFFLVRSRFRAGAIPGLDIMEGLGYIIFAYRPG